jgi:hypothetical protein
VLVEELDRLTQLRAHVPDRRPVPDLDDHTAAESVA